MKYCDNNSNETKILLYLMWTYFKMIQEKANNNDKNETLNRPWNHIIILDKLQIIIIIIIIINKKKIMICDKYL